MQRDAVEPDSQQRQSDPSLGLDFDWQPKDADSFLKYQAALPPLQRPGHARYSMPSAPSPPAIPPDFPGLQAPLFNFPIFDQDRSRGRNARLPVAVTSTLLANPEPDDLVLQLLGDAQSYAASGTNQLPVNEDQRQHMQSALAQSRIQHLAASAQERLRVQNPSFPPTASHSSSRQTEPRFQPEPSQHDRQTLQSLAGMLQQQQRQPMHSVHTVEHYEPQGSGRPGRTAAQQSHSYQPPSNHWTHRQVLPTQAELRPGLTRLTPHPQSPLHSPDASRQFDATVDLPWDLNTWGRLPADIEQKQQQQQQQERQQQLQPHRSNLDRSEAPLLDSGTALTNFAALHNKRELAPRQSRSGIGLQRDSAYYSQPTNILSEHCTSDTDPAYRRQPPDAGFGYRVQPSLFDAPHSFLQTFSTAPAAGAFSFHEPFAAVGSGHDAAQAYAHWRRQELQNQGAQSQGSQGPSQQQSRQNPFPVWANQVCCCCY